MRKILLIIFLIGLGLLFWHTKSNKDFIGYINGLSATSTKMASSTFNASNSTLNDGLVAYWTFDETDVSSTHFADVSGNGNHAAKVGNNTKVRGKIGQATASKGGASGYATTTVTGIANLNNYAVSAWYRTTSTSLANRMIYTEGVEPSGSGFLVVQINRISAGRSGFEHRDDASVLSTSNLGTSYNDGRWHNLIVVRESSSTWSIYNDGVAVSYTKVAPFTGTTTLNTARILGYKQGALESAGLEGDVDDLRVYNRSLSASEAMALYNLGSSKFNTSNNKFLNNGLIAYWTFDGPDITANTTTDKSGNGLNGTRRSGGGNPAIGKIGQALNFVNASDDIIVTNTPNVNLPYSVSFWFKVSTYSAVTTYIPLSFSPNTTNYPYFRWYVATSRMLAYAGGAKFKYTLAVSNTSTWHHYAAVFTSTSAVDIKPYIDGELSDGTVSSDTGDFFVPTSTTWTIGSHQTGYDWEGSLDEIRIYNRELSAQEIKQLYQLGL